MMRRLFLALCATFLAGPAFAQGWVPGQPIRIIVAYVPGGTTDVMGRLVAEGLAERLPRGAVVENRSGASGIVGSEAVARAPADGLTLLMAPSAHAVIRDLYPNLSYDPEADFTPIVAVAATPYVLVQHPGLPSRTLAEFVDYGRAHPGQLNFASTGMGTAQHLQGELFRRLAGLQMEHVSYRGSGAASADMLAGRISVMFENLAIMAPVLRAHQLIGLAVTSPQRSPLFPDLPTIAEAGYGAASVEGWFGLLGPKGLPDEIVLRLNALVNEQLRQPAARERLAGLGARVLGGSPDDLARLMRGEREKWGKVIREANIRPE
jgi:tripartite-type tricarboxylate transporter receptor subunit TctC